MENHPLGKKNTLPRSWQPSLAEQSATFDCGQSSLRLLISCFSGSPFKPAKTFQPAAGSQPRQNLPAWDMASDIGMKSRPVLHCLASAVTMMPGMSTGHASGSSSMSQLVVGRQKTASTGISHLHHANHQNHRAAGNHHQPRSHLSVLSRRRRRCMLVMLLLFGAALLSVVFDLNWKQTVRGLSDTFRTTEAISGAGGGGESLTQTTVHNGEHLNQTNVHNGESLKVGEGRALGEAATDEVPADGLITAEGTVESRIQAVCSAHALSSMWNKRIRATWQYPRKGPSHADGGINFHDLFENKDMGVREALLEEEISSKQLQKIQVLFEACPEPVESIDLNELRGLSHVTWWRGQALRQLADGYGLPYHGFAVYAPPDQKLPKIEDREAACKFTDAVRACYRQLRPSNAIKAIMAQEDQLSRMRGTTAVYIEEGVRAGSTLPSEVRCAACGISELPLCAARRMAMAFLRNASVDFTVAATWAQQAQETAKIFVAARQPYVLQVTRRRLEACPPLPDALKPWDRPRSLKEMDAEREKIMKENELKFPGEEFIIGLPNHRAPLEPYQIHGSTFVSRNEEVPAQGAQQQQQQQQQQTLTLGRSRRLLHESSVAEESGPSSEAGLASPAESTQVPQQEPKDPLQEEPEESGKCAQLKVAEMMLLAEARGLIHCRGSVAADFIEQQAERVRSEEAAEVGNLKSGSKGSREPFVREFSLCNAKPIPQMIDQIFSRHMVVDDRLKAIYCYIPKVACTSWKTWLRQVQGLGHLEDHELTHSESQSGLSYLHYAFTEEEAIRRLTDPEYFKFSFVRDPFSRLVSVYLDKHVGAGRNGGFTRQQWNDAFFGYDWHTFPERKQNLLPFESFVQLASNAWSRSAKEMEHHMAPQVHLCGLDQVKYDFVGRFEELDAGVNFVTTRFKKERGEAFSIGKSFHATNANTGLRQYYKSQKVVDIVAHMYADDMRIPLNNVTYKVPNFAKAWANPRSN